ncbi:DUF4352 domain-containing protein, partial [Micromonospora fluostatini]
PRPDEAGDTLVLTDDDGVLEITVTKFSSTDKACRSFSGPPSKGLYLIAEVEAEVTKGTSSINPIYFEWVAEDGTTTNGLAGIIAGCGDSLASGNNLPAGTKRSGVVVFNVADDDGVLEYNHRFRSAGSWRP